MDAAQGVSKLKFLMVVSLSLSISARQPGRCAERQGAGNSWLNRIRGTVAAIVARHHQLLPTLAATADDAVGVRMAGIEMVDGDPVPSLVPRSRSICRMRSRVRALRSASRSLSSGPQVQCRNDVERNINSS